MLRTHATATALTAAAMMLGTAGLACGQNLIVNPSFDDTDLDGNFGDGWGTFGAAGLVDFFGDDNPGHGFLFGDQLGNSGGVFQAGIPAVEGQEYLFSIRALYEDQWDAATFIGIEFYAADDVTKVGERKLELIESNGTGYDLAAVSAVAPAGAAFVRPIVEFNSVGSAGAQRGAAFDNAELREISVGDNRSFNPGFLDLDSDGNVGDGWFSFGAAGFLDFFGSGNPGHGTLFGDNIFNEGAVFQLRIPAVEGTDYEVSADIQFESEWDADARLAIEFYASDDATKLGETVMMLPALDTAGQGYKTYRVSGTAPTGTAYVRPIVDFDLVFTGGVNRASTIDNVIVREAVSEQGLNPSFEDIVGDGSVGDFWGTFGAAGFDTFFPATGTGHAVLFGDVAGNEGGLFQVGIPAVAGETYELSLSASFEAEWDADTQFGLEFFEADDATQVSSVLEPLSEIPGAGYLAYSMSATAPAGAERVRPIVLFSNAASTGTERAGTIDDLSVTVAEADCPADVNGDGLVSPSDFNAWVIAFNNQLPECDQNGDGLCNPGDFNAWVLNFNAGCP
ncbi:MAG: GC-type dockerin domain-anchored protein [Planctomycetota bacterium]